MHLCLQVCFDTESSLSRESSLSMEQHTRVGGENSHLTSSLVAHHFKVWFVCFWQQRDRCLKLEPFARNFLAFNETLRIQGSLPCEMKSQHQSYASAQKPLSWQLSERLPISYLPAVRSLNGFHIWQFIQLPRIPSSASPGLWGSIIGPGPHPLPQIQLAFPVRVEQSSASASQNQRKNSKDLLTS